MLQMADVTFTAESSIWRTVDAWAKPHGYRLIECEASARVYEKSHHLSMKEGRVSSFGRGPMWSSAGWWVLSGA